MKSNDRFSISEVHVRPFERTKDGFVKPLLNEYPTRWCVIDNINSIAIDIELGVKYNYIPTKYNYITTCSGIYMLNGASKLIKDDKRAAVISYANILCDLSIIEKAKPIIEKLKNNYQFVDGNDLYSNEEYLKYLKQEEKETLSKEKIKTKKMSIKNIFNKKV